MTSIDAIISRAEERCKVQGSRLTEKRKLVLAGLISSKRALSAYELVDIYQAQNGETITPMSVYRILAFLEGEQLVHKLNLANKYVACAHVSCDHAHAAPQFLICSSCSKVKEINIDSALIADLTSAASNVGYKLITSQLEMNGLCDDCLVRVA